MPTVAKTKLIEKKAKPKQKMEKETSSLKGTITNQLRIEVSSIE